MIDMKLKLVVTATNPTSADLKKVKSLSLASHLKKHWDKEKNNIKYLFDEDYEFKIIKCSLKGTTLSLLVEPTEHLKDANDIKRVIRNLSLADTVWEGNNFWSLNNSTDDDELAVVDFDKVTVTPIN